MAGSKWLGALTSSATSSSSTTTAAIATTSTATSDGGYGWVVKVSRILQRCHVLGFDGGYHGCLLSMGEPAFVSFVKDRLVSIRIKNFVTYVDFHVGW